MSHDQTPVLIFGNFANQRKPRDSDRRGRSAILRRSVKYVNRRSERLVLQASKNIHRSIRVSDFLLAKALIRGIDRVRRFASGNNGNLIVESFGSAEISLSKVWKYVVLNILAVQSDYDPIHSTAVRTLMIGGTRHVARDRAH